MNITNQSVQNNFLHKIAKRLSARGILLMTGLLIMLANVNVGHALVPLTGISKIAAGNGHTCAVTVSGTVKCWGLNFYGQLGDNTNVYRSLPVDVIAGPSLPPLAGVSAISTGLNHTCVLINGGAKCWGDNAKGQLGDGSTTQRLTPVSVVGLGSGVVSIAAAASHTCALLSGGGVKCWGSNLPSRLGDNTVTQSSTPVDVLAGPGPGPTFPLLSGATLLSVGSQSEHTCVIVGSGVSCWGSDVYGQLGVDLPLLGVSRVALPVVNLGGAASTLALGGAHTCAVISGGVAQCWGNNSFGGQLGDNTRIDRRTPVNVVSLTSPIAAITAGSAHTCALTTGGGTKCWGNNNYGQLGDNSMTEHLTPADVLGLTSGVSAIAAGGEHTCALTTAGGVKCWGFNGYGQLGDNTNALRFAPVDVLTDATVPLTFTITPSAGAGGTISPNTPQVISAGGSQLFTVTPNAGFAASVGGTCGGTLVGTSYTTNAITANCTVTATFVPTTFTITPSAGADGTISPSTPQVVSAGSSQLFTVTPNAGFAASVGGTCGGTLAGTSYTTNAITANCTVIATFNKILRVTVDLNADGKSDLIFRNSSTGQINAWLMNGTTSIAQSGLVGFGNWTVSHTADFNGDGKIDMLFRNDNGAVAAWLMNGLNVVGNVALIGPDPDWRVSHVSDFDGDGKADILWRNSSSGAVSIWLMDGTTVKAIAGLIGPDPNWAVSHTADFNSDGKADILWRHTNGATTIWLMNGSTVTSAVPMLGPDANWRVSHVADLDGDGKADLLWRHSNGAVSAWLMNGTAVASAAALIGPDPDWRISHVGDFNGDGKADVLWRNSNGTVNQWLMSGTTLISSTALLGPDANWRVSHLGDYNGDGKADLLWRNTDGSITIWLMNGATILSATGILGPSPWSVVPPMP
jgi:alpha-tubulin suppressor-like RCC1 family protein